jgi:glutamate dehydrogenase (NAD(P)+)
MERVEVGEVSASWPYDDLGPEKVVFLRLPAGSDGMVVIDNVALGPAIGGVRMTRSVDADEVGRLARAMTIKNAAVGLPHGGGKSGISTPGELDAATHEQVLRAFATAIRDLTEYIPGPDMGTDETAMAWIRDEIGRCVGLPSVLGGIPLDELGATGYGLAVCAETLSEAGVLDLEEARVVVQGFGAVGQHAAQELAARGAVVVAVSDSRGATFAADGLDIGALVAFKQDSPVTEFSGGTSMPRDDILGLDCEILVPAAQADVITEQTVDQVKARAILQGANIPVTPQAEQILHERGVLSVPDVIANAGGVICASVEHRGGTHEEAFAAIRSKIRASTLALVDRIGPGRREPRGEAMGLALERVATAQAYRRRF